MPWECSDDYSKVVSSSNLSNNWHRAFIVGNVLMPLTFLSLYE